MEVEQSILLHANPEVIAWERDNLVYRSRRMTGAEQVGECQEAKMHWMRNTVQSSWPEVVHQNGSTSSRSAAVVLQNYVTASISTVKPLLSDPSA
jgi:hypothetical protein